MTIVHTPPGMTREAAAIKMLSVTDFKEAGEAVCTAAGGLTVSPSYVVGWDNSKKIYVGVAEYGADQNGPCYGDIMLPLVKITDENGNVVDEVKWFALVTDVVVEGKWRREVWEIQYDEDLGAYKAVKRYTAPVILKFVDENGDTVLAMPLGISFLVVGAIALIGGAVAAVAYKLLDWKTEQERAKMVEYLAQVCRDKPDVCHMMIAGVAADDAIHQSNGFLEELKELVKTGAYGIITLFGGIMMLLKLQMMVNILRSLFKRE